MLILVHRNLLGPKRDFEMSAALFSAVHRGQGMRVIKLGYVLMVAALLVLSFLIRDLVFSVYAALCAGILIDFVLMVVFYDKSSNVR